MLPVGLCEWEVTNIHPVLTKMFIKNILRTFKAEIPQKYSLNQSSDVLIKKESIRILSTLYSIIVLLLDRVYN